MFDGVKFNTFYQRRNTLSKINNVEKQNIAKLVDEYFPFQNANVGQKECIIDAIDALINKKYKHVVIEAPTGVGKSIIAATIHNVINYIALKNEAPQFRTTITTPTKGLQEQYINDKYIDIDILKGKKNYKCKVSDEIFYNNIQCRINKNNLTCDIKECEYFCERNNWTDESEFRCTNTSMLIEMCPMICCKPNNRADMIILDECHKTQQILLDHCMITFDLDRVKGFEKVPYGVDIIRSLSKIVTLSNNAKIGKLYSFNNKLITEITRLGELATAAYDFIEKKIAQSDNMSKKLLDFKEYDVMETVQDLGDVCEMLGEITTKTFMVQEKTKNSIVFKPILASDVAEYGIFRKADYFIHMSATICGVDTYMQSLGIRKGYYFISVKNPIPIENRIIHFLPILKNSGRMDMNTIKFFVSEMDEIIDMHDNQSGIIHTVSYERAKMVVEYSRYKDIMYIPNDRNEIFEIMKSDKRHIIVSPAIEEGYDFKDDISRFQIIMKVPYDYLGDPLISYTSKVNPNIYFRNAVLRIVQMCGRSVRGINDYATTYIVDSAFESLHKKNFKYFPAWFNEAIQ